MRKRVYDIANTIYWSEVSRKYFGKSSSWLYHKLDGLDGGFSEQEAQKFKEALLDLSARIKDCADNI